MLILGSNLRHMPIMSLQTGGQLAVTKMPVVDPGNLKIVAYEIDSPLISDKRTYLRTDDTRELSDIGFIVDSIDDFVSYKDVIKLREIIDLHFRVDGIKVINEKNNKIGRVTDYTIDVDTFTIQQLTVKRPLMQRFNDTELLVHRSQITDITDDSIVIHSEAEVPEHTAVNTPGSYVNPFRSQAPKTTESVDILHR